MKCGVTLKIVKSTLFKRVLTDVSAMPPSSGHNDRLAVYQDAMRACIKVAYDTERPLFSLGDGSAKSLGDLQKSWRRSYLFERVRAGTNGEAKNFAKDTTSFNT